MPDIGLEGSEGAELGGFGCLTESSGEPGDLNRIAKLRAVRTNDAPLIMRCEMGAGHAGPSGRYDLWREEARTLSFLITTV